MPEAKKYLSKIGKGGGTLWLKDAEARQEIADIKLSITGAMHWKGFTTTALTDGATTNPVVIGGEDYTAVSGDVVAVEGSGVNGAADKEFVFNGTKWQEYGSTGSLKALAFKDNASTEYTPAGTNQASAVSFEGQTDGDFVTGFNNDAVAPSKAADTWYAGSLPTKAADTWDAGSLPTLGDSTKSGFATEGEVSTYDEESETLTFADATTAQAVTEQGTFSQGSLPSFTEGAFTQGSLPSFTEGAFDAGSAATPTKAKAITAVGTGTAAAQVFGGSQATITVQ